jgi:phosphoribosylglycinamide formyltransferase-1
LLNLAVLVSGGGTNLQAILDAVESGAIQNARVALVISGRADAYALTRAKRRGVPVFVAGKAEYPDEASRNASIAGALRRAKADLIILAGYMNILPPALIREFAGRIINIHPSLIPKFCGMGYYGKRVHQAVLDAGETESGATVHYVDEGVDTGPVILQRKVPVLPGDDADALAARVLRVEHEILVLAVRLLARRFERRKSGRLAAARGAARFAARAPNVSRPNRPLRKAPVSQAESEEETTRKGVRYGKKKSADQRFGQNRRPGFRKGAGRAGHRDHFHGRHGRGAL